MMEFRNPSAGEMTYAEVREEFFKPPLAQSDSDSGDDSGSEDEEEEEYEVEKIVSHRILVMVQSNTGSDGKGMTTEVTSTGLKSNYRTASSCWTTTRRHRVMVCPPLTT